MNKVNTTQSASNTTENVMPMPLDFINDVFKGGYDEKIDRAYMKLLQSDVVKKIRPYVDKALEDEKYEGSPIYNGYIDRDTINTIVDRAIYYASQDYPEITQLFSNIDTSEYSKTTLLRALVHQLVLSTIYYELRPENKNNINYDNKDIVTPVTEEQQMMPMDNMDTSKNDDIMPLPLGA